MCDVIGDRGRKRCRASIANEIIFATSCTLATLAFLFVYYDGFHPHVPSLRQLLIGIIPQVVFTLIWRHYIFHRMHHPSGNADHHEHEKEEPGNFLHQLMPYWYRLSCVVLAFGNCLLPLQIVFGDNQLDPATGDPYRFGIICAICHAFMDVLLGLNLMTDICSFIARKIAEWMDKPQLHTVSMQLRRKGRQFRAPVTFLLSAKIVLGGVLIASEDPIVVKTVVPIRSLPEALEGFRIIQLSDIHMGVSVGRTRVERVVDIVNDLCNNAKGNDSCNLIALTGDVVDGEPYHLMKAIEPLKSLASDKNTAKIFVPGNHEIIHQNVDHVIKVLADMGIDSLVHDSIRLPKGKPRRQQLAVVGLNDYSFRPLRGRDHQAFEGTDPERDTIILLAHQPNHLGVARRHGVDLMLSGHTHAGQFFPGTLGAWLFNARFSGYYPSVEKTAVYVSAGTHWWGPPVRFTTRRHEIADIRLVKLRE